MSTLKTDNLSTTSGNASAPVETIVRGSAKAFVNFDASSGTPIIRNSLNVSSITDNGVGDYTVNFTNPLQDANYIVTEGRSGKNGLSIYPGNLLVDTSLGALQYSSAGFRIVYRGSTAALSDVSFVGLSVFS